MVFKKIRSNMTKKVKRGLTGVVAGVLLASSLTGCSSTELELLKMNEDVTSWEAYTSNTVVTIEVGKTTKDYINSWVDEDEEKYNIPSLIEFKYVLRSDSPKGVYDYDGTVKLDNVVYPAKVRVTGTDVLLSRETIRAIVEIAKNNFNYTVPEHFDLILESLSGDEFLYIGDVTESYNISESVDFLNSVKDGIAKMLKDYSTDTVKKNEAGEIVLSLDIDSVEKIIIGVVDYFASHRDDMIEGVNIINKAAAKFADVGENDIISIPTEEDVKEAQEGVKDFFNSEIYKGYKADYNKSFFKGTYSFKDGKYVGNNSLVVNYKDEDLIKFNVQINSEKGTSVISELKSKDLNDIINSECDGEHFPSCGDGEFVTVTYEAGANTARIVKKSNNLTNFDSTSNIYIIDDRAYLPMREIAEALGYKVEWDEKESKAYVIVNDEYIDMTGTIINDLTYIKVRDFEKLGLTVSYIEDSVSGVRTIKFC